MFSLTLTLLVLGPHQGTASATQKTTATLSLSVACSLHPMRNLIPYKVILQWKISANEKFSILRIPRLQVQNEKRRRTRRRRIPSKIRSRWRGYRRRILGCHGSGRQYRQTGIGCATERIRRTKRLFRRKFGYRSHFHDQEGEERALIFFFVFEGGKGIRWVPKNE